jgi:hypothetical protein
MFIDPTTYPKTCAPAERDVFGNGMRDQLTFRSPGARRNFLEVARSINIASLRDEEAHASGVKSLADRPGRRK